MRKNKMKKINKSGGKSDETVEPSNKDEKLNKDLDPNLRQVNGPINVVRLEGTIGGTKKVIYLFFDIHADLYLQTKCTNIYSKDVNMFFAENFYELNKADKKYDFFMEIRPSDVKFIGQDWYRKAKNIYIDEMTKLFSAIFQYDEAKNKVNISDKLKNIRLHYLDVRDYFQHHITGISNEALNIAYQNMYHNHPYPGRLDKIIEILKAQKEMLDTTINIFMDPSIISSKEKKSLFIRDLSYHYTINIEPEIIANLSNKIKNRYNYTDVQKKINIIFDDLIIQLKQLSNDTGNSIDKIIEYINILATPFRQLTMYKNEKNNVEYNYDIPGKKRRMIMLEILNICEDLHYQLVYLFARLTDIYFLRRFLDKDYITNAIVFSGAYHSEDYIEYLVKYFDFKITHVAYALDKNIDELNKMTKDRLTNNETITDIFYPPELYQCSDITHFPKNFA